MKAKSLFFLMLTCISLFTSCKKSSSDNNNNTPAPYKSPYDITSLFTQTGLGDDFTALDKLNPSTMDTVNWYNASYQYWTDRRYEKTWGPLPADFGQEARNTPGRITSTITFFSGIRPKHGPGIP
jgi:hypothetical protein